MIILDKDMYDLDSNGSIIFICIFINRAYKMLWKKEFNSDGSFIDYFAKLDTSIADLDVIFTETTPPPKSNRIADRLRQEGNCEYKVLNCSNAILAYNYALCFAEPQSDALAQTYANRSACYFLLDRFKSSDIDIKLALNVATDPNILRQIKQHQIDCKQLMEANNDSDDSLDDINQTASSSAAPNHGHNNANESIQWLALEPYEPFRYRFTTNTDIWPNQLERYCFGFHADE